MNSNITFLTGIILIFNLLNFKSNFPNTYNDKHADAESRAAVSHVEPQSSGGSAADPTGSTDSGCRSSWTDTRVSMNAQNKHT